MGFTGSPTSLNPVLGGYGPDGLYPALAYDTLFWISPAGTVEPDLATSWHYVGSGNKVFEFNLRPNVHFQDGSVMTANSVVASIKYFLKAGGAAVSTVGQIASVSAIGPMSVRVTYAVPNPVAPKTMDQTEYMGFIIGPKGLADPKMLLNASDGTGQYEYVASKSTPQSLYYYTRNPHYWNPSAQMYSAVAVHDILSPSAMLSAVQTGQIQWGVGNQSTETAARAAGITVRQAPFFNWSLGLSVRSGSDNPLAKQAVREAIGYAFNREQIVDAIGPNYAHASAQVSIQGTNGYTPAANYTYDIAKAKALLASAGYPSGFSLTILAQPFIDPNTVYAQTIAGALSAIGIKAKLHVVETSFNEFLADAFSKQYSALVFPIGGPDMWTMTQQFLPFSLFNPEMDKPDAAVQQYLGEGYASTGATQIALYHKAAEAIRDVAWVIPVFTTEELAYVGKGLTNVQASLFSPVTFPTAPSAANAWHPTS